MLTTALLARALSDDCGDRQQLARLACARLKWLSYKYTIYINMRCDAIGGALSSRPLTMPLMAALAWRLTSLASLT